VGVSLSEQARCFLASLLLGFILSLLYDLLRAVRLRRAAKRRFTRRVEASLLDEAVGALSDAKKAHDALESAYHPCVDFEGGTALAEKEIKRLLKQ